MRSILGPVGIDTIGMEMQLLKPASQAMIKKKKKDATASMDLGSEGGKELEQKGRRARQLHEYVP